MPGAGGARGEVAAQGDEVSLGGDGNVLEKTEVMAAQLPHATQLFA